MPSAHTKDRILDAAESLFADHGFAGTSLRTLTTEADVNLAAVNYHFGSKEALFQEVFARRVGPLNRARLELLDACENRSGNQPPSLEEILHAFLAPALRLSQDPAGGGAGFLRLMGRIYTEPGEFWKPVIAQFEEVKNRFVTVFRRALPDLPPVELFWRMHFLVGAMCHTMVDTYRLEVISGGLCDPTDCDGTIDRLVTFAAAGLRAPVGIPGKGGGR